MHSNGNVTDLYARKQASQPTAAGGTTPPTVRWPASLHLTLAVQTGSYHTSLAAAASLLEVFSWDGILSVQGTTLLVDGVLDVELTPDELVHLFEYLSKRGAK